MTGGFLGARVDLMHLATHVLLTSGPHSGQPPASARHVSARQRLSMRRTTFSVHVTPWDSFGKLYQKPPLPSSVPGGPPNFCLPGSVVLVPFLSQQYSERLAGHSQWPSV